MGDIFDLVILGGGPGGYVAAERAGHAGLKVLLVEKAHLGGVCLNSGCIPTKTLLNAAKTLAHAREAGQFGVTVEGLSFNLEKAMAWKTRTIETLRKGIAASMKKHRVEVAFGEGRLLAPGRVAVGEKTYHGKSLILATGSRPFIPPIPGTDSKAVLTSTEILELAELPSSLIIVGGGYIGMEFASFFSLLGVKVTVVEMLEEIVPTMDRDFAAQLRKAVSGVTYELGARVESINGNELTFSREGTRQTLQADRILLSVGRRPNLEGLGLEELGIAVDRKGIAVDEQMRTNVQGVYAIGDVTGRALLAHTASRMGEVAVNTILGREDRMRYHAVPWVVFTHPEVAGCGLSEAEARSQGLEIRTATLPLRFSGRYLAEHPRENGSIKVVIDKATGVLLGMTMLGSGTSELIFGAALMIEAELRAQDVRDIIFPHPTVSEVLREAMFDLG